MTIHIGISGWRYTGWRGVFYPKGLAQALWQFPPNFPFDATRLERFLALLPQTIDEGDCAWPPARCAPQDAVVWDETARDVAPLGRHAENPLK